MPAQTAHSESGYAARSLGWADSLDTLVTTADVHIVFVDFDRLLETHSLSELTDLEHRRSERIRDTGKRLLYLAGRLALRKILAKVLAVSPRDLEFVYGPRGKPTLLTESGSPALHFNYTLSQRFGLYAVSPGHELGVDLEMFPRKVNAGAMARTRLHPREQSAWDSVSDGLKNDAMLACWTRKEAYGKLLGVGIRYHLNQVPLFCNLQSDQFLTEVRGLFESNHHLNAVSGIQIGLPHAGAAAVMFPKGKQWKPVTRIQSSLFPVPC
ncbi:MAG: 4'-phosphopantetheinyl transferase superfamily protein [Pseudomonadota bacterium]